MSHLLKFKTILELKRYSVNTIYVYINFLEMFVRFLNINPNDLKNLGDKDILLTIIKIVKIKNYSASSQKQVIGAISLFYKEMYKREINFSAIYPTQNEQYLPVILSKSEVKLILAQTKNLKHKAMLACIYGLGLRVGEVLGLKIKHIDSDRMLVHIHNAKGKKDRIIMLPDYLLKLLRQYFKAYTPNDYLFEGQSNKQYSASSIRKVFKKSLDVAKIKRTATLHSLRHSFATHLLENGTDIRIIQKLLGHKSIKTTLLYTQVAQSTIQNVQSPIDTL